MSNGSVKNPSMYMLVTNVNKSGARISSCSTALGAAGEIRRLAIDLAGLSASLWLRSERQLSEHLDSRNEGETAENYYVCPFLQRAPIYRHVRVGISPDDSVFGFYEC